MIGQATAPFAHAERYMGKVCSSFFQFVKRQWHRCTSFLLTCWRRFFVRPELFPLTEEQRDNLRNAISIDEERVRRLVSRHSDGIPCEIRKIDRGSYNLVISLGFFDKIPDRLLRIPLQPAVCGWTKVQSEVMTLEYLRKTTSIPVPRVWAYGKDARITTDPCDVLPYLLCDYIPGKSLQPVELLDAASEQRIAFFSDLINIYAQLYKLRFPIAGSLIPTKDGGSHIGRLPSMASNELAWISGRELLKPPPLHSSNSYAEYQLHILSEWCRMPLIDAVLSDAREEVFALHHLNREVRQLVSNHSDENDTFILTHPDLHYANIIVDDNLEIQGMIDWEFAGTVPSWLFTPPAWATGHDGRELRSPPIEIIDDFQTALDLSEHEELKGHWRQMDPSLFATAHILCRPTKLERLFFQFIFPKLFTGSQEEQVLNFFADGRNAGLAAEAEELLQVSNRYTAYLKATGLYDAIEKKEAEQAAKQAELVARMAEVLKNYQS